MVRIGEVGIVEGEQLTFVLAIPGNLRVIVSGSGSYDFLRDEIAFAGANIHLEQLGSVDPVLAVESAACPAGGLDSPIHHDVTGVANSKAMEAQPSALLSDMVPGRCYEISVTTMPL